MARTHPAPMPESIWADVVRLAEHHSIAEVSDALRLNPGRVWQHVNASR